MLKFDLIAGEPGGQARVGRLTLPHGQVHTPAFMPVGTRATVKGIWPDQVQESGAEILLCNTYHLSLRPGAELVADMGGLHRFMAWDGPLLTDSGGYQVFSLADLREISDERVTFRSHIDGQILHLNPETAIRFQNLLGADIIMCLDHCPPADVSRDLAESAVARTLRWAEQCRRLHRREDQALFGIVQGALYDDLRRRCLDRLVEMDFPGYAIGGLAVGESYGQRMDVLRSLVPAMPADRPRYLMGVGKPRDLLAAVRCGIDMFDCVLPTRNGRNACAFTATGTLKLRNERFRRSAEPLEPDCPCPVCRKFTRAYIRHLFIVGEMLGPVLVSLHNLWFFQRFMRRMRDLIPAGDWGTMLAEYPIAAAAEVEPADDGDPGE